METTPTAPPPAARIILSDATPARRRFSTRVVKAVVRSVRGFGRLVGTLFTIGLSLLPLSALLVALPAVAPNEAVLTETVRPAKSWARRTTRRVFAVLAGMAVLVALLAFSIEVVSHLPTPSGGQLGTLARKVLGYSVADFVPDDKKPTDAEPLKGLIESRKAALKANVDGAAGRNPATELAPVNREIADWGVRPENMWMLPPDLVAARAAAKPGDARDRADAAVADRVVEVTGRWLPAQDLLDRRKALELAAGRPNLNPRDKAEAEQKLAEADAEVAQRRPNSAKLRLMLDPVYSPVLAVPRDRRQRVAVAIRDRADPSGVEAEDATEGEDLRVHAARYHGGGPCDRRPTLASSGPADRESP